MIGMTNSWSQVDPELYDSEEHFPIFAPRLQKNILSAHR
jgi:hypothetical protein